MVSGALVAARWSSPSVCRLRRPWQLDVFSRRASGISGEAEAGEAGEAAEVEIRKKGLDESALNLDPDFWENTEGTMESEWCAVYINLARRQDRRETSICK